MVDRGFVYNIKALLASPKGREILLNKKFFPFWEARRG
ncbi:MAG: hypothetical protein ACI94Y_002207 [Maribacter sp.]|jgi:hypothetical protein